MATTSDADETNIASHTLAYLRTLDRKLDVVVDALQRQGERLARVERDIGETRIDLGQVRRDIVELKSDIALLDNKTVTAQTAILAIAHRLNPGGAEE